MIRYKKRSGIIILVIIFYLVCLALTMQLDLDEKITSMLPDSDPYVSDFTYIIDNIPATETLYIDIENKNPDHDEQFKLACDIVFDKLKGSLYFLDITYRFSNDEFINLVNILSKKKYSLLNENDIKMIDRGLNQDNINKKLAHSKRKLLNPSGFFMADKITKDPLGFEEFYFY